jgi:preprotein translocase subunit SecG
VAARARHRQHRQARSAGQQQRTYPRHQPRLNAGILKKEIFIVSQLWFFGSIAFSFIAWGIVTARYIWPDLRIRQRAEALRPVLILHSFRFIGLAFLVPGVVSPDLPSAFAHSAAYGDIIAAILALLALISLPSASGVVIAWIFSLWGTADLFNAFYQANHAGLMPGQLGATYFIPTFIVPLLLITHGLAFRILLQHQNEAFISEKRQARITH